MCCLLFYVFFFKQKTAYEMRISDWSSDVCSSDLGRVKPEGDSGGWKRRCVHGRRCVDPAAQCRGPHHIMPHVAALIAGSRSPRARATEIGRASCRERVCQYV